MSIAQQDPAKLDTAIAEADRLLARNAMYWPMVSLRADLSLDKRDIKAAIGILERFLQAQPASDEARIRLIDMQIASGNVPRAIEVARAGVDLRPQDPVWAERLGDLLQRTNDSTGAAREFERAFTLDPKSMVYLEKSALARLDAGDAAGTLNLLRGASYLAARSTILRAVSAAALAKSGRRDEGLIAGREALAAARIAPENAIGTTERTVIVLRQMFAADKTADFETFLMQGGTAPTLVEEAILAETWSRSGPTGADKALEWCSKVDARVAADAKSVPPSVESAVALTRGAVLYGKGDLDGACTAFVRAAQLSNNNPAALNNAAYLLSKVRKDYPRAFELASRAVLLAPAQPDYLDTLGFVLLQMGRLADAEDALNKSVAASPTTSGLLHLAQVRAAQGNIGDARQILDRARARPADPDSTKDIEAFAETLKGK
jgi:tetratricopeptide (TPR) repeat protein